MPSDGSPRIIFRCPPELKAWLDDRVRWSKTDRRAGEHTLSSFIVELIEEGRKKRERSRTWRRTKKARQRERQQQEEPRA